MKKTTAFFSILALFGLGFAFLKIYRVKKSFRNPIVEPSKVGKISYKNGSINLYFDLSVENPNDIKITVNSVDLTVYDSKNNKLANVRNDKINTLINPKSTTKIKDIKGKIGAFDVFSFLLSDTTKREYKIIGDVKVENFIIPVNYTLTV